MPMTYARCVRAPALIPIVAVLAATITVVALERPGYA